MTPFLSIIIPVYNNREYIASAIENFISQKCEDCELLIMDGGSSDGTVDIIASFAQLNNEIRWVSEKDSGQSDAMNKGIALSKGKYISFLNVDDYYSENCLVEVCQILKQNTEIQYLVGNCNVWDQFGNLIYVNKPNKTKLWHVLSGYHFSVNPTAYFYLKRLHDVVGLYPNDNHFNMDLEMIIRFREVTFFHYYPCNWGNFRMLPNAKTFEDKLSNKLEERKKELLNRYLTKQSFYMRVFVYIYSLKRKNIPKIKLFFRRLVGKLRFEFTRIKF